MQVSIVGNYLTATEFLQPLDTPQLADYIQGLLSMPVSDLKRPAISCMHYLTLLHDYFPPLVGISVRVLWSAHVVYNCQYFPENTKSVSEENNR